MRRKLAASHCGYAVSVGGVYLALEVEIVAPCVACGVEYDDVYQRPKAERPVDVGPGGVKPAQGCYHRHGRGRERPRAGGYEPALG